MNEHMDELKNEVWKIVMDELPKEQLDKFYHGFLLSMDRYRKIKEISDRIPFPSTIKREWRIIGNMANDLLEKINGQEFINLFKSCYQERLFSEFNLHGKTKGYDRLIIEGDEKIDKVNKIEEETSNKFEVLSQLKANLISIQELANEIVALKKPNVLKYTKDGLRNQLQGSIKELMKKYGLKVVKSVNPYYELKNAGIFPKLVFLALGRLENNWPVDLKSYSGLDAYNDQDDDSNAKKISNYDNNRILYSLNRITRAVKKSKKDLKV